ncbi:MULTISPECIES: hypothetical protein [Providencia]|uniref:hypothetical protein n=1 Tax=Providencia TaxID=586 RepID=UPI001E51CCE7|nr:MULTISPECIES: hypothetical protein [Providencia]UEK58394.1 hypothetical protein LL668_13890 [Providencia rettgeri]
MIELKKLVKGQLPLSTMFFGYWLLSAVGMFLISVIFAGTFGFYFVLLMLILRPILCLLILSGVIHHMASKITMDNLIVFSFVFAETLYWSWNIVRIINN